ncbi:MAG: ribulose-phosphate 3-epimerase [Candidatus Marinimicrobia bacterium]|nr:ribulose-phosphate 3-epimerase [Candidatus Neomarinimicrobiota bacterium]
MKKLIAPSILSSDFMNLESEIRMLEKAGADWVHCDIMDGHFVPNLTFGPPIIKQLRKLTDLPLDVHLMITNPEETLDQYIDAGADWLSFHIEAAKHPLAALRYIKGKGVKAGIVIKPMTSVKAIKELLPNCDYVLIMSVEPGFGGQSYIESANDKAIELAKLKKEMNLPYLIQIDGGITVDNIKKVSDLGVEVFVAGSAVFGADDPMGTIKKMKELI